MSKAYVDATAYLARREHSALELTEKLAKKGHTSADIAQVLAECRRLGLQCDTRFATMLCQTRIRQGYGPIRIAFDLKKSGVDGAVIESVLASEQDNWVRHATQVWRKKYLTSSDRDYRALAKQKQFLLYRGFPMDVIYRVIERSKQYEDGGN